MLTQVKMIVGTVKIDKADFKENKILIKLEEKVLIMIMESQSNRKM